MKLIIKNINLSVKPITKDECPANNEHEIDHYLCDIEVLFYDKEVGDRVIRTEARWRLGEEMPLKVIEAVVDTFTGRATFNSECALAKQPFRGTIDTTHILCAD
jgi:hypothetical protein